MFFKKRNADKKVDPIKKTTIVVDARGKMYKRTTIWHPLLGVAVESTEAIKNEGETISL